MSLFPYLAEQRASGRLLRRTAIVLGLAVVGLRCSQRPPAPPPESVPEPSELPELSERARTAPILGLRVRLGPRWVMQPVAPVARGDSSVEQTWLQADRRFSGRSGRARLVGVFGGAPEADVLKVARQALSTLRAGIERGGGVVERTTFSLGQSPLPYGDFVVRYAPRRGDVESAIEQKTRIFGRSEGGKLRYVGLSLAYPVWAGDDFAKEARRFFDSVVVTTGGEKDDEHATAPAEDPREN